MSPKEALEIIDRAASSAVTNRQNHLQIINAVQTVYSALEKLQEIEAEHSNRDVPIVAKLRGEG